MFRHGVGRMAPETLEAMIGSYMATPQPLYQFGWQGGEPTLLGAPFFRRVVETQRRRGRTGASVANGLQTNGTLLDDEMARLFAEYKFLVGVSLDGPPELHDRHRRDPGGHATHARVLEGLGRLKAAGVETNILVLVTSAHAGQARRVMEYLAGLGYFFQQYIPCVEADREGRPRPWSVEAGAWGDFLCELFDAWREGDGRVSVRLFDALLARLAFGRGEVCHLAGDCRQYFLVEHDGGVYPCDFFVEPGLRLGNVRDVDWGGLWRSPAFRAFGARKAANARACARCPARSLCAGDCPKHRLDGLGRPSRLCGGWKRFYAHALPGLRRLARALPGGGGRPA